MIGIWKQFFDGFIRRPSYQQRMNDYLSQATSREHLEYLENQWFKQNKRY